jgi:hypothetical protein
MNLAMRHLASIACSVFLTAGATAASAATLSGATGFPAPGGTTFVGVGNSGAGAGRTGSYSGFNFAAFDQLWWGPNAVRSAMDGAIDEPGESMVLTTVGTNQAVWTGTTDVASIQYSGQVLTRYTATLSGAASNWIFPPAAVGIPPGGPQAVTEITGNFSVHQLFEASINAGASWTPFLDLYNSLNTFGSLTRLNVSGEFYSTTPLPAAIYLFGTVLGGLVWLGRRRSNGVAKAAA